MDEPDPRPPAAGTAQSIDDAVMIEQMRIIHCATPYVFVLLSLAAIALGATFFGKAPHLLTILPPLGVIALSGVQFYRWFITRDMEHSAELARIDFRTMEWLSVGVFIFLGLWVWSFTPYASPTQRMFLAFYIGFSGVGISATLLPRPGMIALNNSLAMAAFFIIFLPHGEIAHVAMGAVFCAAYGVFYFVSHIYKQRIRVMVEARAELEVQNRQARHLLGVNRSLARTDALTQLPNRREFFETLDTYFTACPDGNLPVVGIVDLDGFKPINDVFGHASGDAVLIESAARLKQVIGERGAVARLGGDEFAYLLPWHATDEDVAEIAYAIKAVFQQPFKLQNGETNRISASVGYSSRFVEAGTAKALLEQADLALYRAKSARAPEPVKFSSRDVRKQRREGIIDQALRAADLDEEITLLFQPVVDSNTGLVLYCEALSRWHSPELGLVSPAEFVPIAEKAGLTRRLTLVVMRKVIQQLRAWPEGASASINLSAQDVASKQTVRQMVAMLGVQPVSLRQRISIELTEFSLLSEFAEVTENLKMLRNLGLRVALDDFGTGFSSLSYIQELEFDVVKIDKGFVASIGTREKSFNLVRMIHSLTRNLSIDCVTEGVETREQLQRVRAAGGRLVQGYLYSRPMPADALLPYVSGTRQFPSAAELLEGMDPVRNVLRSGKRA